MCTLAPGLSIEGSCKKDGICVTSLGYGTFDIAEECCRVVCRECSTMVPYDDVNVIYICNCCYSLDAMNPERERIQSETLRLTTDDHIRINVRNWVYIEVTTTSH